MSLVDYLLARAVLMPNGCLEWTGHRDRNGYGRMYYDLAKANGVSALTSRAMYQLCVAPIGPELHVDHLCRNPPCMNPDHLEAVTPGENTRRSPIAPAAVNHRKTHCNHGHEFNEENTYRPPGTTDRACRACGRESTRRYIERKVGCR